MDTEANLTKREIVDARADEIRKKIKKIGEEVWELKTFISHIEDPTPAQNIGEMMANVMLSYRHLEDSSMKLGKVKQHNNTGESPYDKNVVGSPE